MKNSTQIPPPETIPGFHTVEFFRAVKEQIARETEGMNFEELKRYMDDKLKRSKLKPIGS